MRSNSASADCDHDFQPVFIDKFDLGVTALGHDLSVDFDRYAFAGQAAHDEQRRNRARRVDARFSTVDDDGDHNDGSRLA